MTPPAFDAVVIGAGAAGLVAATHAAERGRRVLLLEKSRKSGVKMLMSGGTRCNITHDCDARGIVVAFVLLRVDVVACYSASARPHARLQSSNPMPGWIL